MNISPVMILIIVVLIFVLRSKSKNGDNKKKGPTNSLGESIEDIASQIEDFDPGAYTVPSWAGGGGGADGGKTSGDTAVSRKSQQGQNLVAQYVQASINTHQTDLRAWLKGFGTGKNLYASFPEYSGLNAGREALKEAGVQSLKPTDHIFHNHLTNVAWYEQYLKLLEVPIDGQGYKAKGIAKAGYALGGVGKILQDVNRKKNFRNNAEYSEIFAAFNDFKKVGGTAFLPRWDWIEDNWVNDKSPYGYNRTGFNGYKRDVEAKMPNILKDATDLRERIVEEVLKLTLAIEEEAVKAINGNGMITLT